jgi:hypothetical protein
MQLQENMRRNGNSLWKKYKSKLVRLTKSEKNLRREFKVCRRGTQQKIYNIGTRNGTIKDIQENLRNISTRRYIQRKNNDQLSKSLDEV